MNTYMIQKVKNSYQKLGEDYHIMYNSPYYVIRFMWIIMITAAGNKSLLSRFILIIDKRSSLFN